MRIVRIPIIAALAAAVLLATGAPASAHVSIPEPAEKGGYGMVTLRVPNERDETSTTKIEVKLPEDSPLASVSVQPKPGWTVETTMRTLDEPVDLHGSEVTEVVDTVVWEGGEIAPGQFDTFAVNVGRLPEDVDELVFPTIQTYSDGEEVSWIEVSSGEGEEVERPAPVLQLVDAPDEASTGSTEPEGSDDGGDESASAADLPAVDGEDDGTDALAVVALIVAVLAALLAGGALVTGRRRA